MHTDFRIEDCAARKGAWCAGALEWYGDLKKSIDLRHVKT